MRSDDLYALPNDLPVPVDDGASDHLPGLAVPDVALAATDGATVRLAALPGRTVVYIYPRTGVPDRDPLPGWDDVPGSRGCTPQSCAFRDHHAEVRSAGARLFGLSSQDTAYQLEAVTRLHLPFAILSDERFELAEAMRLPEFTICGVRLLKRLTMILRDGRVEKVFYPVFPPDRNAVEVIAWLRGHPLAPGSP